MVDDKRLEDYKFLTYFLDPRQINAFIRSGTMSFYSCFTNKSGLYFVLL